MSIHYTVFILIEAHTLIEAQEHFFLEKIAIIWQYGPNLAIKRKNEMHKITLNFENYSAKWCYNS